MVSRPFLFLKSLAIGASLINLSLGAQSVPPDPKLPPAGPELTLQECINQALQHNFRIKIDYYNPQIAKDSIDIACSRYKPVFKLTTSRRNQSHSRDRRHNVHSSSSDTTLSLSHELYTGTTVALKSKLASDATVAPNYNANVTVSVRQKLLQGFGTTANRAAINRAKFGYDAAKLTYEASVMDVIQLTENAYYSLVYVSEQLNVHNTSFMLAKRLYNEAIAKLTTGVATDLDVLTAKVGLERARRQIVLDNATVKNGQDALLTITGRLELDTPLDVPAFKDKETDSALPFFASSFEQALRNQPDYLAARAKLEQAKLNVVTAKNTNKPNLSVGLAADFSSHSNPPRASHNNAYVKGKNIPWQIDALLTYPWGCIETKARYRQSLAKLTQQKLSIRRIEQSIKTKVRSVIRTIETNTKSVKISSTVTELAGKKYELQKAKFDAGLATSREVLQAQTDLETARLSELQAKVSLRKSYTVLHRLEGSLLQRYHVSLPLGRSLPLVALPPE